MPARTKQGASRPRTQSSRFNEGAGTCPPGLDNNYPSAFCQNRFNEGAGTCPPGPVTQFVENSVDVPLQ